MRWPWQKQEVNADAQVVIDLFMTSQNNLLSLAQAMLAVIDEPELVDDSLRTELVLLIEDLQNSMAVFKEHVLV